MYRKPRPDGAQAIRDPDGGALPKRPPPPKMAGRAYPFGRVTQATDARTWPEPPKSTGQYEARLFPAGSFRWLGCVHASPIIKHKSAGSRWPRQERNSLAAGTRATAAESSGNG